VSGSVIPQSNPSGAYRQQQEEIDNAISRVMDSGWYVLGHEVREFELEFAGYIGVRFGVGVASGTDAIELALRAHGIGTGDVVFTVAHTAVATVVGIERSGAHVAVVDIDPKTATMSPTCLSESITSVKKTGDGRVAAIVPVHLYGHPADMPAIMAVAHEHNLVVVEDCAQAHGAKHDGIQMGSWGNAAAFSFYPTKNMGAFGDGGIVVSDDEAITNRARELRQYGWRERFISEECGLNSRLDELQAAILRVRLKRLDTDNERRRWVAHQYRDGLRDCGLQLPHVRAGAEHVYHQYVVQTDERDALRNHLTARGVGTAIHYPKPVHLQPAYKDRLIRAEQLPVTEAICSRILSLPMFPQLAESDAVCVTEAVREWDKGE
jgi:dTDP-4-amino-4,6-dideoxygalactose transaminase